VQHVVSAYVHMHILYTLSSHVSPPTAAVVDAVVEAVVADDGGRAEVAPEVHLYGCIVCVLGKAGAVVAPALVPRKWRRRSLAANDRMKARMEIFLSTQGDQMCCISSLNLA